MTTGSGSRIAAASDAPHIPSASATNEVTALWLAPLTLLVGEAVPLALAGADLRNATQVFAGLEKDVAALEALWDARRAANNVLDAHRAEMERAAREADYLRHVAPLGLLFGAGIGNTTSLPPLIAQVEFVTEDVARVIALIVAVAQGTYAFAPAQATDLGDLGSAPAAALSYRILAL